MLTNPNSLKVSPDFGIYLRTFQYAPVALQRRLIFPLVLWFDRVTENCKLYIDQNRLIRCRNVLVVRDILKSCCKHDFLMGQLKGRKLQLRQMLLLIYERLPAGSAVTTKTTDSLQQTRSRDDIFIVLLYDKQTLSLMKGGGEGAHLRL